MDTENTRTQKHAHTKGSELISTLNVTYIYA